MVLIQEMDVKVDMGFLMALMGLFSSDAIDRSQEVSVQLCGGGGGGGGVGGHFHFRCFESCREVDYPSFCFDDSYRMVVHLLLVLSYGFCDLRLFLFFVNFNQTQEIVFCGYLSRYPSSERELKIKTKLFYQLRGA